MRYEDMKQRMVDIDLLEKDLMRDLTVEEKDLVEALMKQLHLDLKDLHLVHRVKGIVGLYLSGESEEFDKFAKEEDNVKVIELLEDIISELKKEDGANPGLSEQDMIKVYSERLKKGETLELDDEVLDKVVDYLWENESNVRIEVRNNKIRLR